MQVTREAEQNTTRRVGVKEDLILFQSPAKVANMKKFLINRGYSETPTIAQPEIKSVFQPPLPTYPPPPDSPPNLNITIKQEKEDPDTQNSVGEESVDAINQELLLTEPEKTESDGPKETMCKEWARGECKRPICKFSHVLDISQLPGVYTFCWNYQNARCSHPNCKFVHATIFEEARFLRTGILPPHAKRHLKKPLPLPPPPPPDETQNGLQSNFSNPPPAPVPAGLDKMPVISTLEQRPEDFDNLTCDHSPLKREWSDIDIDFSSSPRDIESNEHLAKKCKTCGIQEFRLQFNKKKFENMIQRTGEINEKMYNLNKKRNKLTLIYHTLKSAENTFENGDSLDEKFTMEQLISFINGAKVSSSLMM